MQGITCRNVGIRPSSDPAIQAYTRHHDNAMTERERERHRRHDGSWTRLLFQAVSLWERFGHCSVGKSDISSLNSLCRVHGDVCRSVS